MTERGSARARGADWAVLAGGAVLTAATIGAYGRTFSVPLLFDDVAAIADNASIRHWSTAFWAPITTTAGGRPVLNLSLAVNYAIGGTAVGSYHAANLAIHVLGALTLFGILRRTLALWAIPSAAPIAFCAALLWSLHPLQTESVTYIVQRAESLMGLFYLLTLYCFIRGSEGSMRSPEGKDRPQPLWAGLSIAACLLGMATKEVMVSAPLIVFLYDRTFLAGSFREAWGRRWRVHAGLAATWLILPFLVLSTHGRGGSAGFGSGIAWWTYAATQPAAILRYLKLTVWPHPLVFYYGTEWVTHFWAIVPSVAIVLGLAGATLWALARRGLGGKSVGFAGAWFFAILAPTSLVPVNLQTAAEHRMYLALIPMAVLAVIGIYRWTGRLALPLCLALAAVLFWITWRRNEDYRSALVLWTDTVARRPENPFAHYNLGYQLQNLPARRPDAITQYEEALRLRPEYAEARTNLGLILEKLPGRLDEALAQYEEVLRLNPDDAGAHTNLGNALRAEGRTPEAIAQYEEALRLNPSFAEAHNNLGNILNVDGRTTEAIAQYEEALRLKPDYAEAHDNLGNALEKIPGRLNDAISQFEEAARLEPDDAGAHEALGNALERIPGRLAEAIAQYEEALRLKPDYAEAHNNLGNSLNADGRTTEAIAQYGEALRLNPEDAEAHNNLGCALESMPGRAPDAIAEYEEALRLKPDYVEALNNLGNALEKVPGRLNEAIARYEEALRLKPDYAAIHFNLAVALLQSPGGADEAVTHLETVLRLQPGNDSARQILAGVRGAQP